MTWVRGIYGVDRMRRKQGANGQIGSLVDATGEVPVFDLGAKLGRAQSRPATQGHIVVFPTDTTLAPHGRGQGVGNNHWGLLVDRVSRVVRAPSEMLFPMAPLLAAATPQFQGVLLLDDDMVLMLAPARLVRPLDASTGAGEALALSAANGPSTAHGAATMASHPVESQDLLPSQEAGPVTGGKALRRLVLFSTSDPSPRERPLSFGVSLAQVLEVMEPLPLLTVPLAPTFVLGIARWRNQPVLILDLATSMGLPPTRQDRRSRLLILRVPQMAAKLGVIVRPSVRVLPLPTPHWPCRQTPAVPPRLVMASADLNTETVVIPDLGSLWRAAS
jgi:chemotaxis signal transduction protein